MALEKACALPQWRAGRNQAAGTSRPPGHRLCSSPCWQATPYSGQIAGTHRVNHEYSCVELPWTHSFWAETWSSSSKRASRCLEILSILYTKLSYAEEKECVQDMFLHLFPCCVHFHVVELWWESCSGVWGRAQLKGRGTCYLLRHVSVASVLLIWLHHHE